MTTNRTLSLLAPAALASLAALLAAAPAAHADTTLSGTYINSSDGYVATSAGSPYTVTSAAQFAENITGLFADGATVTVSGGTFHENDTGLQASNGASVTVNSGTFSDTNNAIVADSGASVTVNGGTFRNNFPDLFVTGDGTITLYGTDLMFDGMPGVTTDSTKGDSGTITGTLQDNQGPSTLTYQINSVNPGTIRLVDVPAVPEPATVVLFAQGAAGLLGLTLRARRRKAA